MPSYLHELLLLLFQKRSASAADLLRELDVQLPEYDNVCIESSDLNHLRPAEYAADLVLFLLRESNKVLGIIVEVQLGRDEDKPYTWPAYVANLRARHRCPVCLLIVTVEESVARWARKSIELGPGSRCTPWVVGPSNAPAVTELRDAQENVELSVLSAVEHGQSPDLTLATRIASAAVVASAGLDAERFKLYLDLILISLSENVRREVLQVMNSLGYEYQSDFARHYVAQGRAEGKIEGKVEGRVEGKAEGRLEIVLKQLTLRFGPLAEAIQTRVRSAPDAQLDAVAERVLTAQTLDEALAPLS
jgi:Domain of unknown function (DUF4351)